MYLNGSEELHTIHNQVMSTINLFHIRQEGGKLVQNLCVQFTAMRYVCYHHGQMKKGARAVLKKEGVTEMTAR